MSQYRLNSVFILLQPARLDADPTSQKYIGCRRDALSNAHANTESESQVLPKFPEEASQEGRRDAAAAWRLNRWALFA